MKVWQRIKKPLISLAVVGLAGIVVFLVARMPAREESIPFKEAPPVNVEVLEVRALPQLVDQIELPGSLVPNRVIRIPVELSGKISRVLVKEGQRLQEGDLILELDAALLRAEFDRARAQWEFDERTHQRSLELLERGVLNKSQVEEAAARSIVSRAVLEVAETNLSRTSVYSPSSGVLNDLLIEAGEFVSTGDPVAELVETDRVKVVIQLPEKDIQYLRKGTQIPVIVEALNLRLLGEVTFISETADELTKTTRVEVTLDNGAGRLRGGLIVRAEIPRRVLRNVVMIPLSAVIPLEDGRMVYVSRGDEVERREVVLGILRGSEVQVIRGLEAGDQLIVTGHRLIGPGQKIRVVKVDS